MDKRLIEERRAQALRENLKRRKSANLGQKPAAPSPPPPKPEGDV